MIYLLAFKILLSLYYVCKYEFYLYIFDDGGIQFSIEGVGRVGVAGLGLEQVLDPPDKPK